MTEKKHHDHEQSRSHDPEGTGTGAAGNTAGMVDMLLAHYVAGGLPRPIEAMIGAHLEMREDSRCFVDDLETLAGRALTDIAPEPLRRRDEIIKAIIDSELPQTGGARPECPRCAIMPERLAEFTGFSADTIPWRRRMPGFKECRLGKVDGCDSSLLWIRAGRKVPQHTHDGVELTLVLQGSFTDGQGTYRRGDIAMADETVDHRPEVGSDAPCMCFAVTTGRTKFTGSLGQLFSDLIG